MAANDNLTDVQHTRQHSSDTVPISKKYFQVKLLCRTLKPTIVVPVVGMGVVQFFRLQAVKFRARSRKMKVLINFTTLKKRFEKLTCSNRETLLLRPIPSHQVACTALCRVRKACRMVESRDSNLQLQQ